MTKEKVKREILKAFQIKELDVVRETLQDGKRFYYHDNRLLGDEYLQSNAVPLPTHTEQLREHLEQIVWRFEYLSIIMSHEDFEHIGYILELLAREAKQTISDTFRALSISGIEINIDVIEHTCEHFRPGRIVGAFIENKGEVQ